jgi:hypothetical protein
VLENRDRCVERVDTPELVQPMELDREEARKERHRARARSYYIRNKERKRARNKAYYTANRDDISAQIKAHYAANRDDISAKKKSYYAANRDDISVQRKAYYRTKHGCFECSDWPDWQYGSKRYDGRCHRCHAHKFPDDPRLRAELIVREYINHNFKDFIHDHMMPTAHCDCNHLRRIDHRCVVGNTLLCIETDEHWHRNYKKDDEDARYHDMIMAWGGRLCFVRFNPDPLSRNDEGPPLEERLERLHAEMTRHIGRLERGENTAYLEVWHLYYPEGWPDFYDETCVPEGL